MINISTIYKITSPSGKVYIGQTKNFEARLKSYRNSKGRGQHLLGRSISKYGWESHKVEILYIGPLTQEGLNQLEIHYIRVYNSFGGGLNLTEGGGGTRAPKSEEWKQKMREIKTGRKRGPQTREWTEKIKATRKQRGVGLKPVDQYSLEGEFIRSWPSLTEASSTLGINKGNICSCLKGDYKTARGFIWKYSEE